MKKLLLLAFLTSCAHQSGVHQEYAHLDEVSQGDSVFYVLKEYTPKVRSRQISSIHPESEMSNRDLYFSTLYHQFKKLAKLSKSEVMISTCPAFHQTWIELREDVSKAEVNFPFSYAEIIKKEYSYASFPELALRDERGDQVAHVVTAKVDQKQTKKTIESALKNYNQRNLKELKQLCDTGVSDQYFIFENMISYYSTEKSFQKSGKALKAFMKMPVVANSLLIDRFHASTDFFYEISYRNQSLSRLGASWFENYLYDLKNLRQNLSNISFNKRVLE